MKRYFMGIIMVLMLFVAPSFALNVPSTHLVSVQWLSKNINNSHLVIVDVRSQRAYLAGHIPHAVNIPKRGNFQKGYFGSIKHVLDTPFQITKILRKAGISNNSIVVLYSGGRSPKSYTFATREFWTMWMYGIKNIAILNGGFIAWKDANKPVSRVAYKPAIGTFKIHTMELSDVATWPDIYYAIATHKVQLVDAREPAHYKGVDHDRRLPRHGHIPGAVEVAYYNFVKKVGNDYKLLTPNEVVSVLRKYGIDPYKPIIVYCNTGHLASGVWFNIKMLAKAKNAKLYDGSMYEYSRMPLPIAK